LIPLSAELKRRHLFFLLSLSLPLFLFLFLSDKSHNVNSSVDCLKGPDGGDDGAREKARRGKKISKSHEIYKA
jgi:hypothetical protein